MWFKQQEDIVQCKLADFGSEYRKEQHHFIELTASGPHKKVIHQRCVSMTAFEARFINLMPGMRFGNESSIAMASCQYTPYPSLQIWPIGNLVKM